MEVRRMVAGLDRLVRREEFLREEDPQEQTEIFIEWKEYDPVDGTQKVGGEGDARSDSTEDTR